MAPIPLPYTPSSILLYISDVRTDTAADRNTDEYTADAHSEREREWQTGRQPDKKTERRYADIFTEIEYWQTERWTAGQTHKQQTS